jgi:hypothetical protein
MHRLLLLQEGRRSESSQGTSPKKAAADRFWNIFCEKWGRQEESRMDFFLPSCLPYSDSGFDFDARPSAVSHSKAPRRKEETLTARLSLLCVLAFSREIQ